MSHFKETLRRQKIGRKTSLVLRAGLAAGIAVGGTGYWAHEYPDQAVSLSRKVIGQKLTVELIEKPGLYLQDKYDQIKFIVLGGDVSPYSKGMDSNLIVPSTISEETEIPIDIPISVEPPMPPKPVPMVIPETNLMQPPVEGEGIWTTEGLPRSTPEDPLMVRTFLRPDSARPYARVDILLIDKRRVKLNIVGGTVQPGIERGVKGSGIIPEEDKPNLLAAWNGGFQGEHASWGTYINGREYKPLRNGYAAIATKEDGTILIGEWGRTLSWEEGMVSVRQNAKLLLEDCELTTDAREKGEDPNTWGRFLADSPVFITSRSAVGLTRDGDLMVAVGNSISAKNLAYALKNAGACTAMQLDINEAWVTAGLFFPQEDGTVKGVKLSDKTSPNPTKYIDRQPEERDFMYLVHDDTNYKP